MSLILDALRKADAERERGAVPSLHSQPVMPPSAEVSPKPAARPNWLWIAIGIAVGLAAAAAWVMVGRDASPPTAAAPQSPAQASAPTTPSAPGATPPAVAVAPTVPSSAATGAAIAEPAPWPQPEERKAARPETKGDAQAPVPVLGNVPLAQPQPPAQAQVYSREQLPPDIRAALPQLTIGGSIYSPNPSGRSLIVNGQLFRERERLTQELSLDEIKLKAAVFSFRGYRFEVLF